MSAPVARPKVPMTLGRRLARATRGAREVRLFLILATPTFWLTLFLIVPLIFIGVYGFSYYDDAYQIQLWPLDGSNYRDALSLAPDAIVIPLVLRTFGVASLTTIVSLVVGYAMAYYIARLAKDRWKGLLMGLVVIPFWVSFIVRIYAVFPFTNEESFVHQGLRGVWLGDLLSGAILWFFELGTGQMVVFTLMYVWLPFMILPLFASLSKVDPQLLEAAYDLGASRWRAFLHVTLPLTYPAMIVGSVLVFITSVGAFIETEMVGGRDWLFIGNYIQSQFSFVGGLPQAMASAIFIIVATVLLISVYRRYAELEEEGVTETRSRILGPLWRYLRRILPLGRPKPEIPEPSPTSASMPDGGAVVSKARFEGPIRRATWEKILDKVSEKGGRLILGGATALILLMFFVPLIIVGIFSFNSEDNLFIFGGFSLDWWVGRPDRDGLFQDDDAIRSIGYSFLIAGLSSGIALFFGLLAAFALNRYRFRARGFLKGLMYLGLVIPSLIVGISIAILIRFLNFYILGPVSLGYGFGAPIQWEFGLSSVVVGHATFTIPLATLVLLISFREFDRTLEEAAMNLGADEITTFLRVTIPNIMPGILSAILLGFTFSFDELPVTLFLYGQDVITVPVFIYGLISKKILSPRVNAASVIVLLLSLVFVVVMTRVGKKGGQLFRI